MYADRDTGPHACMRVRAHEAWLISHLWDQADVHHAAGQRRGHRKEPGAPAKQLVGWMDGFERSKVQI
jgi:hypothetical protein